MDTHIVKQQQMLDPISRMPFSDTDKSVSSNGILPFANSENIAPPVNKEKIRVVDQATRSSVNMDLLKEFYDKQDIWLSIIKDLRLRAYFANDPGKPTGGTVDISI